MDRRAFMQVLGVAPIAAGIPMGEEVHVWVTLRHHGVDVTERLPVLFRWNAKMTVTFAGRDLFFSGSAVYLSEHDEKPFEAQRFTPISMREEDQVNMSWIFRQSPEGDDGQDIKNELLPSRHEPQREPLGSRSRRGSRPS